MTDEVINETELEEGQFEVNGVIYELRFNYQKIKTVELMTKRSVSAETVNNSGVLSLQTLEALFTMGLVEVKGLKAVGQKKAAEMWPDFLASNGALTVNNAILDKLQEDCGFLFH